MALCAAQSSRMSNQATQLERIFVEAEITKRPFDLMLDPGTTAEPFREQDELDCKIIRS